MAMGGGGGGGVSSDINVTPLIDVLLVLIIIFMVLQPQNPKGLEALVPQPPKDQKTPPPDNDRTIVLQVLSGGGGIPIYKINDQQFAKDEITPELTKIFETRQEKVMFIKGDKDLSFGPIAEGIGFGKAADVTNIGIITPQVEAGH
jgi:biopolymer transport protein TolR